MKLRTDCSRASEKKKKDESLKSTMIFQVPRKTLQRFRSPSSLRSPESPLFEVQILSYKHARGSEERRAESNETLDDLASTIGDDVKRDRQRPLGNHREGPTLREQRQGEAKGAFVETSSRETRRELMDLFEL